MDNPKPLVFISYSHKDEEWKDRFKPQLAALEMAGQIEVWDDRDIEIGENWYPEIEKAMSNAAVSVCLISEHYLSSNFCVNEEIPYLLERRQKNNMMFLPILISPCPWEAFRWLSKRQMWPRDAKSIVEYYPENWSVPFAEIAKHIFKKINDPNYSLPKPKIKWPAPEKIDIDRLPVTGQTLFGRDKELQLLDKAWASDRTNIISFIAYGGVGKSTLINKWLEYMAKDNYKGAKRVFAWSFYSQGTNERVTSADSFISEALKWFGDPDPTAGSAWDKGQRLANLVRQEKTLLILDGMEPLQSGLQLEKGKLKDPGLAILLRGLSLDNNGLCIITSRETVRDIAKYIPKQKVQQLDLEKLSSGAGRALLRVGGAKGTDAELEKTVEAFGNHALAVKLLGIYLEDVKGHHVSAALEIPVLDIPDEKGKHPRRVIEALSQRFEGQAEYELLQILGLFDRPADIAAIQKIIEAPAIEGLTGKLAESGKTLVTAISTLRNQGLLAEQSKHSPDSIDCHPLIREHFGEKLQEEKPQVWQAAHVHLYEYYKNLPGKELPDTLEEMEPLFAAVMHGCLAGKHQETFDEVYWEKITRKGGYYDFHKLGAFGSSLSSLSNFFENIWDEPNSILKEPVKAGILSNVGFALRAVGRLSEAVQPMKTGLKMRIEQENWEEAAKVASNLSELYLILGNVAAAQIYGAQAVDFADQSGDGFLKEVSRCSYANALHQAGIIQAAEKLFLEAEKLRKKRQPQHSFLYSIEGFKICGLLLGMGKYEEVFERANYAISVKTTTPLTDFGFNSISLGNALMLHLITNESSHSSKSFRKALQEAQNHLNQAVETLRKAGRQDHLSKALLPRVILSTNQNNFKHAWIDLDEVLEIASYGQMRLFLTDYHLEACRVIHKQLVVGKDSFAILEDGEALQLNKAEMQAKFREHLDEAAALVKETGYHRRDGEVGELRAILESFGL